MPPAARTLLPAVLFAAALGATTLVSPSLAGPAANQKPIAGTRCSEFPADNWWHADVRGLPVHARSDAWLMALGPFFSCLAASRAQS